MKRIVLTLAAFGFACVLAQAQNGTPAGKTSGAKSSDSAKSELQPEIQPELQDVKPLPRSGETKLTLKDVGPLGPEDAARMTAKNLAQQKNGGGSDQTTAKKDPGNGPAAAEREPDNAVMEFHPAAAGSAANPVAVTPDQQHKSALKRVHGDLYGAKSGIGNADGGSVGGTSKSGKTSVYVQSGATRSTVPQPQ